MKSGFWKMTSILAVAALFAASCTPEENNPTGTDEPGGGKDGTVHVTGISLDHPSATIKEGETLTLVATVTPDNAANKTVKWSTSSETVATVDNNGKVTGIKAGSATITATTEDGGKKATCSLTVEANLAPSVTVGADHISAISVVLRGKANLGTSAASDLKVGFQYSKSAGILPSNSTTIDADDSDANYNYTKALTGLEPATTYYFRSFVRQNGLDTYGETKEFTTKEFETMLETKDATDIEATSATLNGKLDLTDVKYNSISYGFYWGTSEATHNSKLDGGAITDNSYTASLTNLPHKTQYWFKAYVTLDGQTLYGEVKTFTTDVVKVGSVSLDKSEYTFNTIGNTLTLKATVLPSDATDKSVEWTSSNDDVATVDANGKVTARDNGTATITVTTKDQGKTATCVITVSQLITSIFLYGTSLTLNEGEEMTLTPTIKPDNAADKTLTWTSSDESVAKVDSEGKITAISKGTATIKAMTNDGSNKYVTCSVTVKRLVASIELDKATITLYRGGSNVTETITATVSPSDANNTGIKWTSSNTAVVTVSSSGVVTGKTRGTATITATASDGSGATATCEVEVIQYVTNITLSETSLSLVIGEEAAISVTSVLPDNANDKTYIWSSSDNSIATVNTKGNVKALSKGKATITVSANDGNGVSASCSAVVSNPCPEGAVDFGMTTSEGYNYYWATCNLSDEGFVSSPEGYGDYYAWGETEAKSDGYSWSTYSWGTGNNSLTKYNNKSSYGTVDNKIVLDPEDDAAHVVLGGNWRMPTFAELSELTKNCTWTWTSENGVNGQKVTAPNGNSIFLPAAGSANSFFNDVGTWGCYWSSSLYYDFEPIYARQMIFDSKGVSGNLCPRYCGFSVRPVSE